MEAEWGLKKATEFLSGRARGLRDSSAEGVGVGVKRIEEIGPNVTLAGGVQRRRNRQARGPRFWSWHKRSDASKKGRVGAHWLLHEGPRWLS